jgi:hypothetical protein
MFDRPEVTAALFKLRLDQMKTNIGNGKHFDDGELTFNYHMIEYQYHGFPHAHLVPCLDDAHDIDDPTHEDLIDFVNRHFVAEMLHFEGEEHQHVYM